jgi:hypothetical protein
MLPQRLTLPAILLLLAPLTAAAPAQELAADDDAVPSAGTRWRQTPASTGEPAEDRGYVPRRLTRSAEPEATQVEEGRWTASEIERGPERGAYPARPARARLATAVAAPARTKTAVPQGEEFSFRRSRIQPALSAKGVEERAGSSVKRVWTEQDGAKVKTIYDDKGGVVYRKGWDKKSGEEVPLKSSTASGVLGGSAWRASQPAGAAKTRSEQPCNSCGRGRADWRPTGDNFPPDKRLESIGQDGPHHLRHRHEIVRDGPTRFSLAMPIWYNNLNGTVTGLAGTGTGTLAQDNNLKPGLEWAIPHWFAGYQPLRHTTTVSGAFSFRGTAFPVGANLKLDADVYEGYTRRDLFEWHVLQLDWMLGAKYFVPDFAATSGAATARYTSAFPVPYVGLIGQFELDTNMLFKGSYKYSTYDSDSAKETMSEADISLAYEWKSDFEFSKSNQVALGYRVLKLDIIANKAAANRAEADVEFAGPYAKLTAYF